MKTRFLPLAAAAGVLVATHALAITRYVNVNSATPSPPYTNWSSAATSIQDAVDAGLAGDLILVASGVYQAGGRAVNGYALTNRVAVTQAVTLQSVNGPDVTVIQGYQVPGTANGDSAIRCTYLTNGAVLSGFTLANGATRASGDVVDETGGGVWCEWPGAVVTNCLLSHNSACISGGGAYQGLLTDCTLAGNSVTGGSFYGAFFSYGGGAIAGTLNNCTLTNNSAMSGGGAANCTLNNCTLARNSATLGWPSLGGGAYLGTLYNCTLTDNWADNLGDGGGVADATLYNCILTGNSANRGGAAFGGTLNNCTLRGNSASGPGGGGGASDATLNTCMVADNAAFWGGGAESGTLNNCALMGNSAEYGGGVAGTALNNCTLAGNSASWEGGGTDGATLNNCIAYNNTAPTGSNYYESTLSYCCTLPLPSSGTGNIANAPIFVDYAGGNLRLQSNSPCINAGYNAYVTSTTDLDGNPRVKGGTVDIGAYEFQNPASLISYAWLQQYSLPSDGSADYLDSDGDGMNNWQEWIAGTDPTNAVSVLRLQLQTPTHVPATPTLTWTSVTNRTYALERSTNAIASGAFWAIQSNIPGLAGTTSSTDTNVPDSRPVFYRVRIQP